MRQDTAIPHITGTGALRADEPIIIDLFPVDDESGYYADMTRTVVRGEPSEAILQMYSVLQEAKRQAIHRTRAASPVQSCTRVLLTSSKTTGMKATPADSFTTLAMALASRCTSCRW